MAASRTLLFIAVGLFGLYSVEFCTVGILPDVVSRYGVSVAHAGALVALFAAVVAFCGPAMVLAMSSLDRRAVLTGSLAVFSVCSLASAVAPSFAVLMVLRIPSALLHPVFFSAAFAVAVSLYPPSRAAHATSIAFVGTSMGMVLGVPLVTLIDATVSYEGSFVFCAAVTAAAAVGLWSMLPATPSPVTIPVGRQLSILRDPVVVLAAIMTIFVFAAGFSVYSYAAEYLSREAGLGGRDVSVLLVVFGVGGFVGNLVAGRLVGLNRTATTLLYPLSLALAYGVLRAFGSASLSGMVPVCLLWGVAHTSGLVVSQVWLTSAAPREAREFATSIYLSAANVGVVLGAWIGGWSISVGGVRGTLWSGWLFTGLTLASVVARVWWERRSRALVAGMPCGGGPPADGWRA